MKNSILYNSRSLFYTQGYFKTKILDITKKCGISTGKFYRCYPSKDYLLYKIIIEELKNYKMDIQNLTQTKGDELFKLRKILQLILDFLKKNPSFFSLLIELKDHKGKLSPLSKKSLNFFWDETTVFITEFIKYDTFCDNKKRNLLLSMMENQVKLYIRFLLTEKNNNYNYKKSCFLSLENDLESLSSIVTNTFESLNKNSKKVNIDPLTGAYTNKYFFELLKKNHNNKNSFNLILLDLKKFYISKDYQKIFFRDNIITNTGILLKKNFRSNDLIGKLCPSKFIVLISEKENMYDLFNLRLIKIIEELKIKFPCISEKDITWKHTYIHSKDSLLDKFK